MATSKVVVAILLAVVNAINASIVAPAVQHITYTRAVPYNVLPFANSVNVFTRTLAAPVHYGGIHPAVLRTPLVSGLAPVPKVTSFLPSPFVAPGVVPAPVAPAAHAVAPVAPVAHPVAPAVAQAYAPAYPAPVAPVVRTINPYYQTFAPSPINPAYGRSIHAVAPVAPVAPAVHAVPTVPVAPGVPVAQSAPVAAPAHYIGK